VGVVAWWVACASAAEVVASRRLRGGGAGGRPRRRRLGDALAALSHLQRPLALLAPDVDADLRDLRLRRAGGVAARRRRLRRGRAPAGPARGSRRADGALHQLALPPAGDELEPTIARSASRDSGTCSTKRCRR